MESYIENQGQIPPAFPYNGTIRLLIDSKPWRFLVNLKGLKISSERLLALLEPQAGNRRTDDNTLDTFLLENQEYSLQLEFDEEQQLSFPMISAKLERKQPSHHGLELVFSLNKDDPELNNLINEMAESASTER